MATKIKWARKQAGAYECSSKGDTRFSALNARMPDGRTIEQWYQCDVKAYDPGGTNWRLGKGKPPRIPYAGDSLWQTYLSLWRVWAVHNVGLVCELYAAMPEHGHTITDCFASSDVNQARALATILNDWLVK